MSSITAKLQAAQNNSFVKTLIEPAREQWGTFVDVMKLFRAMGSKLFDRPWRWKEIQGHIVHYGIGTLPVAAVATAFAGLVITVEIAWHIDKALKTISMIPGFTGQFIFREIGIAIPGVLIVSKVGASIAAEVSTMKVTEQVDALKLLKIDTNNYLVFPRWMGCIIATACLTLICVFTTMFCAIAVAVFRYNFGFLEYMNMLAKFIGPVDVLLALTKATAFGAVIPVVSCAFGFRCKGGAEGVGTATTNAVVMSTLLVIILDFVITFLYTPFL